MHKPVIGVLLLAGGIGCLPKIAFASSQPPPEPADLRGCQDTRVRTPVDPGERKSYMRRVLPQDFNRQGQQTDALLIGDLRPLSADLKAVVERANEGDRISRPTPRIGTCLFNHSASSRISVEHGRTNYKSVGLLVQIYRSFEEAEMAYALDLTSLSVRQPRGSYTGVAIGELVHRRTSPSDHPGLRFLRRNAVVSIGVGYSARDSSGIKGLPPPPNNAEAEVEQLALQVDELLTRHISAPAVK